MYKIGILSDTHGLLRDEVLQVLEGCDAILHGGDINRQEIIDTLSQIAPVYVVRGNNDKDWAEQLHSFWTSPCSAFEFISLIKRKDLPSDLSSYNLAVYGHSHRYDLKTTKGTTFLNPGSCGPRRFNQEITLAVLTVTKDGQIHDLKKIDIPHEKMSSLPSGARNVKSDIEKVMQAVDKGKSVSEISRSLGLPEDLTEQICRLYLTHPGVNADGIMTKMGL